MPRWSPSSDSVQVSDKTEIICCKHREDAPTFSRNADVAYWVLLAWGWATGFIWVRGQVFLLPVRQQAGAAWSRVTCVRGDGFSGLGKAQACKNIFPRCAAALLSAAGAGRQAGKEQRTQHNSTKNPELLRPAAGRCERPASALPAPFSPQLRFLVLIRDIFFTLSWEKSKARAAVGVQLVI